MERIEFEEAKWVEAASPFDNSMLTFLSLKNIAYLFLTEIRLSKETCCRNCFGLKIKAFLIARQGKTYKITYCDECRISFLEDFPLDKNKVPIPLLKLIDADWQLKLEEEEKTKEE